MKNFVITIFLLLSLVKGLYAVQRPQEAGQISKILLSRTSKRIAGIPAPVQQKASKEARPSCQEMAARKPGEMQSSFPITGAEKTKECTVRATVQTEESVRTVRQKVHQKSPSGKGPLPSNREKTGVTSQQLQLCNRLTSRFPRTLYQGSEVSEKVETLACAIARAEGYWVKNTIPNRCNNPGDLKVVRGWRYPGQVGVCKGGHVRFKTATAGWAALNHQLDKIINGTSRYSVNMTLNQIARHYAGNYRLWARNVSRSLNVPPNTYLWEVLDVAPKLEEL